MTNANQEVLMNDAHRAVIATGRPTVERAHCTDLAAAGSSDVVAGR